MKSFPACIVLLALAACGGKPKEVFTYSTDPGKDSSIVIEVVPDTLKAPAYEFADTVILTMDSTGKIGWDGKPLKMADLQSEVQDSLLSIYLHTRRLPARLEVKYKGTVTMGVRGIAGDLISQAQEVVKNVVAVAEYKHPFGRLADQWQDSLRKKYPVLFHIEH